MTEDERKKLAADLGYAATANSIDLEQLEDQQLDELFALEVCGLDVSVGDTYIDHPVLGRCITGHGPRIKTPIEDRIYGSDGYRPLSRYTSDFNSVLPYLEQAGWSGASNRCGSTSAATVRLLVNIDNGPTKLPDWEEVIAQSSDRPNDLSRAAVIALILASRKNSHG